MRCKWQNTATRQTHDAKGKQYWVSTNRLQYTGQVPKNCVRTAFGEPRKGEAGRTDLSSSLLSRSLFEGNDKRIFSPATQLRMFTKDHGAAFYCILTGRIAKWRFRVTETPHAFLFACLLAAALSLRSALPASDAPLLALRPSPAFATGLWEPGSHARIGTAIKPCRVSSLPHFNVAWLNPSC